MPKTIKSFMKYNQEDIVVSGTVYHDFSPAIVFRTEDGEPIAKATSNFNASNIEPLPENHIAIKDYSENEGVLDTLINGKIIQPVNEFIHDMTTRTDWTIAKIIDPDILNDIEEAKVRISE